MIVEMDLAVSSEQPKQSKWQTLTIADGLFALVLLGAAIIRLMNLAAVPLADAEAELAWSVWRFWQPGEALLTVSSPAYFSLTAVFTQLFGYSDAVMRLVPALFGVALVALPWLLRDRLSHIGALVACALLAVSPIHVLLSRTVGGDAIALFAVGLLLVAMLRHRVWVAAMAVGLGLASAPLFYSGTLTLAVALWLARRLGLTLSVASATEDEPQKTRRTAVAVGAAVFIASSSFLLWYPAGLGAAARLLGDWLAQFAIGGGATFDPLLALLRYEPALVLLGLGAFIWALGRSQTLPLVFVYWLSALLLLLLVQAGVMANAALFTLPGYLLVGLLFSALFAYRTRPLTWAVAIGLLGILGLLTVNTGRFLKVITYDSGNLQFLLMITIGLILAALGLLFVSTYDTTAVVQGTVLGFLFFFLIVGWGNSRWMGQEAANDPRERWVHSGSSEGVREMAALLTTISRQVTNEDGGLEIASSVDTPALRWYLRDYHRARLGDALPANANQQILITPADTAILPQLGEQYTGTDFTLAHNGSLAATTPTYTTTTAALLGQGFDVLRWWLFHTSAAEVQDERVILWVRGDLGERP
jgi:hypothetical protein